MKRISYLFKEWKKMLSCQFNTSRPINDKKRASELEKEWVNCLKEKENKIPISAGQQELLHHFIHFHSQN
jgi:hypothetical protein